MVYSNQLAYYNAINKSSFLADSGPFIDFMLEEILNALIDHQGKSNTEIADEKGLNYQQVRVLGYLRADRHITAAKIAKDLDMSARQIERMLADLITTISGISLLVSGLHDSHKQTVIVAGFILLLDLIMIVAFLVDYFRKK